MSKQHSLGSWLLRAMGLILACGALAFAPRAAAQEKSDPHRPACTSDRCKKVKAFVKSRYCAASPWGNGPDDGCLLRDSRRVAPGIKITADYMCGWQGNERKCEQHGDPSAQIRDVVTGLPAASLAATRCKTNHRRMSGSQNALISVGKGP